MKGTAQAEESIRTSLEPTPYFFCSAFPEPDEVSVYPAAAVSVVRLFLVDSSPKLYLREWHDVASRKTDDRAGCRWARKNHGEVSSGACFVATKIDDRCGFV